MPWDVLAPVLRELRSATVIECGAFDGATAEQVVKLLAGLKAAFPNALLVVGEFCKQSHESLRKRPTAFLEHHLFHQLTNQRIESAARWREIFARAGLTIREEKVFDLVGHGYFVLE